VGLLEKLFNIFKDGRTMSLDEVFNILDGHSNPSVHELTKIIAPVINGDRTISIEATVFILSHAIMGFAVDHTRTVGRHYNVKIPKVITMKLDPTVVDFIFLYLHIIDRYADLYLDEQKKVKFINMLTNTTFFYAMEYQFKLVREMDIDEKIKLLYPYLDLYAGFQIRFGEFTEIFPKDDCSEGTAIEEFSTYMAQNLNVSQDPALVPKLADMMHSSLNAFNIGVLLHKIR